MNKRIASFALLLGILATGAMAESEHHVKADLVPNGGSGVGGFVQLTQLPHGGTNIHVNAKGLRPGTLYASFYYESSNCTEPADLLGEFTANAAGEGTVDGKIDDDLDEVGSVSVRLGPGYGTLLACATVH
jgi:hypothetical protein